MRFLGEVYTERRRSTRNDGFMDKILALIRRKPPLFLVLSLGYLVLVGFIKWQLHPPLGALWYLLGGIIGIYLLDGAEIFFALNPSPFRSIVFAAAFSLLSLFVVTSSGSLLASGLVFSVYLTLILWQIGQWQYAGNLVEWYRMVAGTAPVFVQRWGLVIFAVIFFIETILFVRWA